MTTMVLFPLISVRPRSPFRQRVIRWWSKLERCWGSQVKVLRAAPTQEHAQSVARGKPAKTDTGAARLARNAALEEGGRTVAEPVRVSARSVEPRQTQARLEPSKQQEDPSAE